MGKVLTIGVVMLEVTLLGQFEVLHNGGRLTVPSRNAQALFAYLLLNPGQAHRRERLAGLLWPDSSEENARSNLRHELWRLRKALEKTGGSYILVDNLTIAFNPESDYSLDVHSLERASLEGSTADELMAALSVYKGELLPGFYHEWVFVERDRLQALFEARMARLLEILLAEGRWSEVQEWASRWIAFGGWPEPAYRALMTAYASTGDVSRAMVTYERFVQGLYQDLGLKPSEQTQVLIERIQAGWKTDDQAQTPVHKIQLPDYPVNKSMPASPLTRLRRSNLPRPLTSFIGREEEIGQVEDLLASARLVTITGSGGVGKTRLAIQVARSLAPQFEDGVWWVELATLFATSPSDDKGGAEDGRSSGQRAATAPHVKDTQLPRENLVIQAVAKVLRISESPGLTLLDKLLEHLYDRQLLLVLDNCEHLIATCAALVERLLGECPQLIVLATSREPLGLPGEKAWPLPSLSLPEIEPSVEFKSIAQSEAVRLFVERTADVLPGYQPGELDLRTISQICLRLDGMPLAIELAAARMNLLSADEIAGWLDNRFSLLTAGRRTALPKHQTLQAAIEWSFDLLTIPEQVFFRRLSVFAGSFTLEAAEAVCTGGAIEPDETLTLLGRLVEKSLLQVDPAPQQTGLATRYRFLDTICSFSRLKLDEAGESRSIRDRHAAYYVRLAELAEPRILLHDQAYWYKLLHAESDNIRAVIEWCVENGQAESALRIVKALQFWWWQSPLREGLDLVHKALTLATGPQFKQYRARALNTAGYLQWVSGDVGTARQNIEEALSIFRELNDEAGLARSLSLLGLVFASEGQYALADQTMQDGIAIARKLGDLHKGSISLIFLGDVALQQGDVAKAKRVYEECTELLRELGNINMVAYPLRRLGYLALERDDLTQAWHYFYESLRLYRETDVKRAIAACLTGMAALALRLDKPLLATRLLGAVEKQLELLNIQLLDLDRVELERVRGETLTTLEEGDFNAFFFQGWELSEDEAIHLAEEMFEGKAGKN